MRVLLVMAWNWGGGAAVVALVAAAIVGCSSAEAEDLDEESEDAIVVRAGIDSPIEVPPAGTTLVDLSQPALMQALAARALEIGVHVGGGNATLTNDVLAQKSALYAFIASDLAADLDAKRARDPRLKTEVANGVTRILDKGWMRASYASFELTGVVNRMDRMSAAGSIGTTCGEVRFFYRLAYRHPKRDPADVSYSRLPVVFNVVYDVPRSTGDACATFASAWRVPASVRDESSYVDYLVSNLLKLDRLTFKQVELNAQVLRVPSELKTDLGGVAEYAFRVYGIENGQPTLRPLENQPDVERILADPAMKAELATYLSEHAAEVDTGTFALPVKFLATKASSFSTFGSARLANKPFTRIFWDAASKTAPELANFDFASATYVSNLAGLVTRLDDASCVGCHQGGRSVAGFHFLGEDSLARSHPLNIARVGKSPHLLAEATRRRTFVDSLAEHRNVSVLRPVSFDSALGAGAPRGAPCLVGDGSLTANAPFSTSFGCAAGLVCTTLATNTNIALDLGQCLPGVDATKKSYSHEFAGLPCMRGEMRDDATDPRNDTMKSSAFACPSSPGSGYTCRPPSIGVPGGLCTKLCAPGNTAFDEANEQCAYAGGKEFDECAGKNDFSTCLAGAIQAGLREACDEAQPCREDYICQRFVKARASPPEAPTDGRGYCVPTYFLFQVRGDGHPNPTPVR